MEDYKKLLIDLYTIHDPERIKQIDYFLEKYKGKERQFYISQKTKYKSKKPISDSKKIIEEALARIKSQSVEKEKSKTKETAKAPKKSIAKPKEKTKDIKSLKPIEEEKTLTPIIEAKPIKEKVKAANKKPEKTSEEKALSKPIIVKKPEEMPEEKAKPIVIKSETPKKTPPLPKPTKTDVQFDKDKKELNQQQTRVSSREKDKHFNKKYFLYIFGIVLLIIIFAVIAFFIFFYNPTKEDEKTTEKPKTTITKKPDKITTVKSSTEKKTPAQPITKAVTETTSKEQATTLSQALITAGNLQLPAYFVACYAVKTENHALKKVNELKAKGFDASYYWIPDLVPQGNTYFKVVIGPFSTRIKAIEKLTPVQERAEFDAYVLELK